MADVPISHRFSFARVTAFDELTLSRVTGARTAIRTAVMKIVTFTPLWLTVLLCVFAAWNPESFLRGLLAGGVAAGAASVLVQVVKFSVRRARPSMAYCIYKTLDRYSFPSGHSCAAFAVATATLFACPWLFPVALIIAAVVSFSRVYLGVHYPSDVLSGAVMGLIVGAATFSLGLASGMVTFLVG